MHSKYKITTLFLLLCFICSSQGLVEGYLFESGNRGYLNQVEVDVLDAKTDQLVVHLDSNVDGFIEATLTPGKEYKLIATKDLFEPLEKTFTVEGSGKTFLSLEMKRAPGYIFDITLAEKRVDDYTPVDAINGALVEVYNNTTKKEELVLNNHTDPDFKVNLVKGNHYTIMVRKEGYLTKRIEAYVDVEGCILCFEGLGSVEPGVSDNLTEGNLMGSLLANVELEPLFKGKKIELQNIYYDFAKWNIRHDAEIELNKVVMFLGDNPHIEIRLGSHTDSRGSNDENLSLSSKRARSAVQYLINTGGISEERISAQGYGENQLANHCADGVDCTEEEHQRNRRTELEIVEISIREHFKSLAQIKKEEETEALILELTNQEQLKVTDTSSLPQEIKEQLGLDTETGKRTIHENFTGHMIALMKETSSLPDDHEVYKIHKDIVEYVIDDEYLYLIGEYSELERVYHDLKIMQELHPDAFVVNFEQGKMVK